MVLRFGRNELNPTSFELRRSNRRVQLAARPMELLLLLVNRRGELVTREEIARSLWPGMDVEDLEARINTAIAQIRAAISEDASKPRYIETVFGKGYRFIGVVETVAAREGVAAGKASVERGANGTGTSDPLSGSAPVVPRTGVGDSAPSTAHEIEKPEAAELDLNTQNLASQSAVKIRSLSLPGLAALVCIVVVVGIGVVSLRRAKTTTAKSREWTSTQITTNDSDNPVNTAAISPNGHWLAYGDSTGIFVREIQTGRTRLLKAPKFRATRLTWFSDETQLLLTGFNFDEAHTGLIHPGATGQDMAQPEIWILSTTGGEARLLRKDAEDGVPSPDGRSVAFTVDAGREIRLAGIDGSNERLIVRGNEQEKFGALFWPAGGRRISYQLRRPSSSGYVEIESNYAWSYCSRDIQTGQETALVDDLPFDSAQETVDGRMFYLRSHPANDGTHNGIWVVATDPSTGRFVESPIRVYAYNDFVVSSGISVTADGKKVVAIKENPQPEVYVGDLNYPGPALKDVKRLTRDTRSDFPHSFDARGQAVYFESNRVGPYYHIFRQRIDSPAAEMLTVGGDAQILPAMMPDGKTLIYEGRPEGESEAQPSGHFESGVWVPERFIYRANADGSDARLVWKEHELDEWRCPLTSGTHCVLRQTDGHHMFIFYLLDPVMGKGRELARTTYTPTIYGDWALSPDGTVAAIPNHDARSPSIRLVRLDGKGGESEIKVRQAFQLWGICWAHDGKGFFAEARTEAQHWLEYIQLSGEVHVLRETNGNTWGVPSPDGKKLAFVDTTIDRNVFAWY
ncbi:MAG: winged helix-turn-helix domain-containing protein [Acidobacteriaceae bacterium]|jgi:DNA-binding winged helix-turn-helix (wHTH) protein/Tol biopolymer transport system component